MGLILKLALVCIFLIGGKIHATQVQQLQKILIVVSSDKTGYWLPEVVEPYFLLEQAGFQIDIASPLGGNGKAIGASRLTSKQETWLLTSKLKAQLIESIPLNKI